MPRTTDNAVKAILGRHYDSINNPPLTAFIESASNVVNWVQAQDTRAALSSVTLELIERWLAAHFYTISDPVWKQKQTKSASGTVEGLTGYGFKASHYGQTAMSLDVTGQLQRSTDGRKVAVLHWLGSSSSGE